MSDLETIERLAKIVEKKRGELTTAEEELTKAVNAHREKLADVLKSVRPQVAGGIAGRTKRGERQARIKALKEGGKTPDEISRETGWTLHTVKKVLVIIEKKEGDSLIDEAAKREEGGGGNGKSEAEPDDDDDEAGVDVPPALAKISALVKRIKDKKGIARLTMQVRDGHSHVAEVNEKGHGYTTAGRNGHTHRMVAFTCGQGPDGHKHEVNAEAAD